jgi:hypothetical protein
MNSAALLVSDDLILRSEAKSVLSELRINCTCSGIMPFKKTLALTKFDAIVLDLRDVADIQDALQSVRTGKLNRYSIVLAIMSDGQSASAVGTAGANFTIRRVTDFREDLKKAFESAHGLILREKRRFQRHSVSVPAEFVCNGRTMVARIVDISERGACLEGPFPAQNQPLQLGFSLPGSSKRLSIEATPAWARGNKLGVQFTSIAEDSKATLSEWLANQMLVETR